MKSFETAVRDVVDEEEEDYGLAFEVDGRELRCYRPHEGQVVLLMASFGRHSSQTDKVAGIIDFFVETLDEPSHQHLVGRLLDRNDPFSVEDVEAIMEWMIEEWSGRPTKRPSASPRRPKRTGPRSTLPTSA
jgi:hypothetical protein